MEPQVRYAFYAESNPSSKGDPTYLGTKHDGLERTLFTTDLEACQRAVKAAREKQSDYRLEQISYERDLFGGSLTTKTKMLAVWPLNPGERIHSG